MDEETGYAWIDQLMLVVYALVITLAVVVGLMEPTPPRPENVSTGMVQVLAVWDGTRNVDVDLWGLTDGDNLPVGYSHKDGGVLALLRDDLGFTNDRSNSNQENMFARNLEEGIWRFNLYLFSQDTSERPIDVEVTIILIPAGKEARTVYKGTTTLNKVGDEKTVARFTLDRDGNVSNLSHIFEPLFSNPNTRNQ